MKPGPFEYDAPERIEGVLEILASDPDAVLMAGNQSLGIIMANRLATPSRIIDLNKIDELQYIRFPEETSGSRVGRVIEIGAVTRHRTIERSTKLRNHIPLLPEAAKQIAGPSVRNRGTIGGSLAEADPAGNLPAALLALEGRVTVRSIGGSRILPIDEFLLGSMFTDLGDDEIITTISVPIDGFPADRSGMAFLAAKHASHTWPVISAATAIRVDDPNADGPVIDRSAIVLANAAEVPIRLPNVESLLEDAPLDELPLDEIETVAREAADPTAELHADEEYKRELAGVYARRSIETAVSRVSMA